MTVAGLGSSVSIHAARYARHEKSDVANIISSAGLTDTPAAIAEISEPAMKMALNSMKLKGKELVSGAPAIPDELFGAERMGNNREEAPEGIDDYPDILADAGQMLSIRYVFEPGSPEDIMNSQLENKSINSSVVANELSNMLRQTSTNKDARVELRAENRESAFKCAEYIADKYLNAGEKKKFMSAVEELYIEDIKTEKGYYELEPDKLAIEGSVDAQGASDYLIIGFTSKFMAEHGLNSLSSIKTDGKVWEEYIHDLNFFLSNASREDRAAAERVGKGLVLDRESNVDKVTKNVRFNFNDSLYDKNLKRLLNAFELKTA